MMTQRTSSISAKKIQPVQIKDEYWTPPQRIWSDVILHERTLERLWKETWEKTLVEPEMQPTRSSKATSNSNSYSSSKEFYKPSPSPSLPLTASAFVGWRSSDLSNSLEFFNVQYKSNRKRFEKEQFGYYRALKYLKEEADNAASLAATATEYADEAANGTKHTPKPLLC